MSRFSYIFLIVITFSMVSCKKEEIQLPESNDPVFSVDGQFSNQDLSLIAGDEGFYMYTMTKEVNGVKVFSGVLENDNMTVEIGLFDGNVDNKNHDLFTQLNDCSIWSLKYNDPLTVLDKSAFPNADNIDHITWVVNGQTYSDALEIFEPGLYHICAIVNFMDGDSDNLCEDVIVGYERGANCRINYFLNQEGKMSAWLGNIDGNIVDVQWYMEDSLIASGVEMTTPIDGNRSELKAVVVFDNGVVRTKNVLVDGAIENKYIDDFTIFEKELYNIIPRDYNIRMMVTKDGISYSSENCDNSNAVIDISQIEYYGLNSAGKKAYNLKANITCLLSVPNGPAVPFTGQVQFGLEIEE